ncbi:MAG: hypothetical protein GC151_14175 [Betaproteobacteria bacterium]|nr:hypothetical protein [Betaproteobacteria bacterium]
MNSDSDFDSEKRLTPLKVAVFLVGGSLLAAGVYFGVKSLLSGPAHAPRPTIQQISVLRPPPPPPPPKPEEKPPEPEVKKEEVKLPQPEPEPKQANDQPPPAPDLGLDQAGTAGSDSFGLTSRVGGRDITQIGGIEGGGPGNRFAGFANLVQAHFQDELLKHDRLRRSDYRAVVKVWFSANGAVRKVELVDGSGNHAIDNEIRSALLDASALGEAPPADMPQPLKLRLTSRGAG